MVEEITQETIQEIVRETLQTYNQSPDISWIPTIGIVVSILVLSFSIYKFDQTQRKSKNTEFMKQIEYYHTELSNIKDDFSKSSQTYEECVNCAKRQLSILDRISYLKSKQLINYDFVQYFENDFNAGITYFKWLKFTNLRPVDLSRAYEHFQEIKNTLNYNYLGIIVNSSFYYYVYQFNKIPNYNPLTDLSNPKTYIMTEKDHELLD